jgi:uncharacterized glyoxalase superfamily protein PhnB
MATRASIKSKAAKGVSRGSAKATAAKAAVKSSVKNTKATIKTAAKKPSKALGKAGKAAPKVAAKAASKAKKLASKLGSLARAGRAKLAAAIEPAPARYHTITPFLNLKGAENAIEFYKRAFGAEERLRMPNADGTIMHAEITIGDSTLMLSDAGGLQPETKSSIHLTVSDCDELFARALAAGMTERMPLQDMFWGDRYGQVEDPFGNVWSIATHKEDVAPEEIARRAAAAEPPPAVPASNSTPAAVVAE